MTEFQLRQKIVSIAMNYLGCKESDGSHRPIIDLYNSHRPLARSYELQYSDPWCAGFVSAMAIAAGMTEIIPTEVGCGQQIALFRQMGRWVEDDWYVPEAGDVIYYDWSDDGVGDNQVAPDHVGLVTACDGRTITVIEGNKADAVGLRTIAVDGRYIRGYGVPDYGKLASEAVAPAENYRYHYLSDVKSALYRATLDKLIRKGFLLGRGGSGEMLVVDLAEDTIRMLVMLDRAGVFGV